MQILKGCPEGQRDWMNGLMKVFSNGFAYIKRIRDEKIAERVYKKMNRLVPQ